MTTALALILFFAGFFPQAAPPAAPQARRALPKPVQKLIESLPPASMWRHMLEHGARGDGIRRPWMNDMQTEGVKLAVLTFEFNWKRRGKYVDLNDWRLVDQEYFRDYDRSQLITDPRRLEMIKASGLAGELAAVALPRAKRGFWIEHPPGATGTGYKQVSLADNEWLPVQMFPWFGRYGPGATPLMRAAMLGNVRTIKMLLAQGAHVNAVDPQGSTALARAAASGTPAAVQALLDAGASVNLRPGRRGDALAAAIESCNTQIVELLLRAGANPNSENAGGESMLQIAAQWHQPEMVHLLLQAGARK